jgi:hypothetical protein
LGEGGEVACQSSNINSTQSKLHFSSPSSSNQITIAFRREEGKKSELCLAVDKKRGPDFPMFQVKVLHLNAPSRNVSLGAFKFCLIESLQTLQKNPNFFY